VEASVPVCRESSTRDGPVSMSILDDPDGRWWRNTYHTEQELRGTRRSGMVRSLGRV